LNICITGGAGYVGSALVPYLLGKGHRITVLDTFWFGDHLPNSPNLRKIPGDIRKRLDLRTAFEGQDAVIHLACISNDPSFDLNPNLGRSINYSCFQDMLTILRESYVKRFIYASSSSIYGVSNAPEVTEDVEKKPLTDYSKFKLACENDLKSFGMGGVWTIIRPATVCGFAPRLRLDLVVNILTTHALINKKMTIFGHSQKRPNINIQDMIRAYDFILNADQKLVDTQAFNVGFENKSLCEIAETIKKVLDKDIVIDEEPTNDPRSYHINSDKILKLGFKPEFDVRDAILSIKKAYSKHKLHNPISNPAYHNIKRMKELGIA
jgi:nucleoside-diphosphate-sugar epimerase